MDQSDRGPDVAFVVRPGGGRNLPFIGSLKASGANTREAFELIEYAGPAAPPPHVHRAHDEAFYILDGTFEFVLDEDAFTVGLGSVVWVPRGTRHGFTVSPGAKALLFTIPAALAGFFEELGTGLAAGRSSEAIRRELADKYDSVPAP